MRIEFLSSRSIPNVGAYKTGEVADLPNAIAEQMIRQGFARPVRAKPTKKDEAS